MSTGNERDPYLTPSPSSILEGDKGPDFSSGLHWKDRAEAAEAKLARQAAVYERPNDGWVCFHCGERFLTPGAAELHFGKTPNAEPGCLIKVTTGNERTLLMELRKAEAHASAMFKRAEAADKALAVARNGALEEAAQVAEAEQASHSDGDGEVWIAMKITQAIRALKRDECTKVTACHATHPEDVTLALSQLELWLEEPDDNGSVKVPKALLAVSADLIRRLKSNDATLEEAAQAADRFADDYKSAMTFKKKRYADYEVESMINAHLKGGARLVAEDIRALKHEPEKAQLNPSKTLLDECKEALRRIPQAIQIATIDHVNRRVLPQYITVTDDPRKPTRLIQQPAYDLMLAEQINKAVNEIIRSILSKIDANALEGKG